MSKWNSWVNVRTEKYITIRLHLTVMGAAICTIDLVTVLIVGGSILLPMSYLVRVIIILVLFILLKLNVVMSNFNKLATQFLKTDQVNLDEKFDRKSKMSTGSRSDSESDSDSDSDFDSESDTSTSVTIKDKNTSTSNKKSINS